MNYKVLYRKYRPDSFENLIGQNAIKEILKNSIKNKKIAHAYLFSGPRGTGKTSTARILAKSINCVEAKTGIACGKCDNCLVFATSPDIIEIDAASNNGVDEIRELINNVKIMPTMLKYKVYIIDEVHMLSQSAFNALLLTLEEPPAHVIFILATTNIESVPITILSRCQKFDFKRIDKNAIINHLKEICQKENINYDEEALNEIASLSDGGMRDALSILDQLSKTNSKITLEIVSNEIGTVSNKIIIDLIEAVDKNEIDTVERIINDFRNNNLNHKVVIKKLIECLGKKAVEYLKKGISNYLTYDNYKDLIIELNNLINKINVSIDPYTLIEIILLKYVDNYKMQNTIVKKDIENIDKIDEKENKNSTKSQIYQIDQNNVVSNISQEINHPIIDIRINNCFVSASKQKLIEVKEFWEIFLKETKQSKIKGLITDTVPVAASEKYIILETLIKHKVEELNQEIELIEKNFNEINQTTYKIIFIDEEKWSEERKKYIENIKNNYKYSIIEEGIGERVFENISTNTIENLASNIFDKDKIEVQ